MVEPINMVELTVFAGVNGAGKSTLYKSFNTHTLGVRINADNILKQNHGDWRSRADTLKAMKQELKLINSCFDQHQSFNFETTLSGSPRYFNRLFTKAHNLGYTVNMKYVGVSSSDLAIRRVKHRVSQGGHGVSAKLVKKRYSKSLQNLKSLISQVDSIDIFDNSKRLQTIYKRKGDEIIYTADVLPAWAKTPIANDMHISFKDLNADQNFEL